MTPKERALPSILDHSRKKRISKGSGRSVEEINQLIKQFNQMSKMMKMMQGMGQGKMMQMMQNMKGKMIILDGKKTSNDIKLKLQNL